MKKATNTYHRRKLNFCSAVLTSPFASGILPLIAALTAEVLISIKSLSPCKLQERCRPRWSSNAAAPVRRLLRRVIDAATLNGSGIRPEWTEFHRNSSISAQPEIKPNRSKISAQFKFSAHKHPSHWIAAALPYHLCVRRWPACVLCKPTAVPIVWRIFSQILLKFRSNFEWEPVRNFRISSNSAGSEIFQKKNPRPKPTWTQALPHQPHFLCPTATRIDCWRRPLAWSSTTLPPCRSRTPAHPSDFVLRRS